jgi:hypothetical protein
MKTLSHLISSAFHAFMKWFDLNCGWFFCNGNNRDCWENYLRKKYDKSVKS